MLKKTKLTTKRQKTASMKPRLSCSRTPVSHTCNSLPKLLCSSLKCPYSPTRETIALNASLTSSSNAFPKKINSTAKHYLTTQPSRYVTNLYNFLLKERKIAKLEKKGEANLKQVKHAFSFV